MYDQLTINAPLAAFCRLAGNTLRRTCPCMSHGQLNREAVPATEAIPAVYLSKDCKAFKSLFQGPCRLQEAIDGDLAVRVLGLLPVVDSGFHQGRYGERSRQRLDLAILSLFQSFRKIYIGEQVMHSSKVSIHPCGC